MDLSKQEILEEEIEEQFLWFKAIIAGHQALKPGDYACKGSLPNPMVHWEDGDKTSGTPHLADIPYLAERDYQVIVVLYQPELDASKKAAADIGIQDLPVNGPPQWLPFHKDSGMIDATQWMVSIKDFGITDALSWPVHPDDFDCLHEDSIVLMEKPGLDIEEGFTDLCSMATSLTQVFAFEYPYSEVYNTYDLMGDEEEVIFCEKCEDQTYQVGL